MLQRIANTYRLLMVCVQYAALCQNHILRKQESVKAWTSTHNIPGVSISSGRCHSSLSKDLKQDQADLGLANLGHAWRYAHFNIFDVLGELAIGLKEWEHGKQGKLLTFNISITVIG